MARPRSLVLALVTIAPILLPAPAQAGAAPSPAQRLIAAYAPVLMLREQQARPAKRWRERLPRRAATAEARGAFRAA